MTNRPGDEPTPPEQPHEPQQGPEQPTQPGYWEQQAQQQPPYQQPYPPQGYPAQGYPPPGYPQAPIQYAPDHPRATTSLVLGILGVVGDHRADERPLAARGQGHGLLQRVVRHHRRHRTEGLHVVRLDRTTLTADAPIEVPGDGTNTLSTTSDRTRGVEAGAGIRVGLAPLVSLVPEVRYRSYKPEFMTAPTVQIANEIRYLTFSLGAALHF